MPEARKLSRALRTAVEMRDRVVVVRLDAAAFGEADWLDSMGASFALLRALELRLIVVFDTASSAPGQPWDQVAAIRLLDAVGRHGQKALALPAAGVVLVHQLALAGPVGPGGLPTTIPMFVPVVDPVLLGQLTSLRNIPVLMLPVVDTTGAVVGISPDEVGAAVARFMDAALFVLLRDPKTMSAPVPDAGRRTLVVAAGTPEELAAEIFAPAEPRSSASASFVQTSSVQLGKEVIQ